MAESNKPILIYCSSGNQRLDFIAKSSGMELGARIPYRTIYYPIFFADQNWKKPIRTKYIQIVKSLKPTMATVVDIESYPQLNDALSWAEELSTSIKYIVMIPKVCGIVQDIPQSINKSSVILGYSVPTHYGASSIPLWEFKDRQVHLLGGGPGKQYELSKYLNVFSADGNAIRQAAMRFGKFWNGNKWDNIGTGEKDSIYLAFEKSCKNIVTMWD